MIVLCLCCLSGVIKNNNNNNSETCDLGHERLVDAATIHVDVHA